MIHINLSDLILKTKVVMTSTFSSFAAVEFVIMATSSAASCSEVGINI